MEDTLVSRKFKKNNYSRTRNPRDKHLPLTFNGENLEVAPFAGQPPPPGTWRGRAAGRCVAAVADIPQVPPQRGPGQVGGEASHLLHAAAPAIWGPGEAWRGAAALGEKGLSLPWRLSGCTRRLVMVSHRAMISSLSSRPSRLRQPSLSGWLSPDISTPKKGGEDDANNVAPLGPRGRRLGNRHRKCLSCSSPLKGLGIPDPWAEVVANEAIRKRGAPTCGSGLAGSEWRPPRSHFREAPRLHRDHRPSTRKLVAESESPNSSGVPAKCEMQELRRCVESGRQRPVYDELP